ncbi:TetR/AcrR family transcriptional regulator [Planotetraspora mira]|nr:TetR/AcrR family transcriptional regulator [Planotetraspora mira]
MEADDMSHDGEPTPRRRRDAGMTREAILRSALTAFTRFGYDGVGVREIAQKAGVTAMLVNRYFGSKEGLFAEVVDVALAPRTVVGDDLSTLSRDAAAALVAKTAPEAESLDPFLLLLRSAANPRAAEILREGTQRHVERHLKSMVTGAHDAERTALFLSVIAGVWLMRKVIGNTALAEADPAVLSRHLEAMFQTLAEPAPDARTAPTAGDG